MVSKFCNVALFVAEFAIAASPIDLARVLGSARNSKLPADEGNQVRALDALHSHRGLVSR
jgi:hypothetical protein